MKAIELKVYETLKNRFSEKEAKTLLNILMLKQLRKIDGQENCFLTKNDKIDLIEKMNKDKIDLIKWMFGFWITIIIMLLTNFFLKN